MATRIRILYAERQGSNAIVPGCAASAPAELLFRPSPFAVLSVNIGHNMEHYGNLVTYTRMKGIVPPRSEQQGAMPAQKQDPSDKK